MPILPALATQIQGLFPSSDHDHEGTHWFIGALHAVPLQITASRTFKLPRTIATLFGVVLGEVKYDTLRRS
jgi:hypothetical protein